MAATKRAPRAIDLYSGVGGWSLGLRLAGIEVVASYEHWGQANETNFKNNAHQAQTVDIRRLAMDDLPSDIDIVVGSPPCTQFSFSNRGGGGDLADGLKDIAQFLTVVDYLKPKVWVMENVPRVAKIIEKELEPGGALAQFAHLGCAVKIVDMAEYGLPQRRRRCIAGNIDFRLLDSFRSKLESPTLGDIVTALSTNPVVDPIYGLEVECGEVVDHVLEDCLNAEEARINKANKTTHTVYNRMPFPDPQERTVRTITATCTRVSRESIVIQAPGDAESYRRLTLRERACLQGFPITFQFYGSSHAQKLRMIGNAVPPAFTYLLGHVLNGRSAKSAASLKTAAKGLARPKPTPVETSPDKAGKRYPKNRNFKFAIPSLQLKSGVRFELSNDCSGAVTVWSVNFYFGTSKSIHSIHLDNGVVDFILANASAALNEAVSMPLNVVAELVEEADIFNMQSLWAHKGPGGTRAFTLLDGFDEVGRSLVEAIAPHAAEADALIKATTCHVFGSQADELSGLAKLRRNAPIILSGLLLGSVANKRLLSEAGQKNQLVNDASL